MNDEIEKQSFYIESLEGNMKELNARYMNKEEENTSLNQKLGAALSAHSKELVDRENQYNQDFDALQTQ